jgi:SAM-dependent methyltransferase
MALREKPFSTYATYYNIINSDKDYGKECNFLKEIFHKYSKHYPVSILDAGCGTGNHLIPLAKSGFQMTGIDASKSMIKVARQRAALSDRETDLSVSDIRSFKLDKKFDAVISMFAVLGYLNKDKDIIRALKCIRNHLNPGGLFVFDVWYGPAVWKIKPETRLKIIKRDSLKLYRFAEPTLREREHLCEVDYHFLGIRSGRVFYEASEKHFMRFYFLEELRTFLKRCRFEILKESAFLDLDLRPSSKTWNIVCISRAI